MSPEKNMSDWVKLYQDSYSQELVDGLIAFYKTPVGKEYLEKSQVLAEKLYKLQMAKMAPMMEKVQQMAKTMAADVEAAK